MFKINPNTKEISITRGDIATIELSINNYTFKVGDIIRFKVFKSKDCKCVELQKDIEIKRAATRATMNITDFEYLKEALAVDLAEMLAKDYSLSVDEALNTLYNSDTYAKLSTPETGLYFQSSLYVYSILKEELTSGKLK